MSRPEIVISLMGGPRVTVDGSRRAISSARAAAVLAELAALPGLAVATGRLIDLIWPIDPPRTATNQVHRLIGELRRLFEPELRFREQGRFILGTDGGYLLDPAGVSIDGMSIRRILRQERPEVDELLGALALVSSPPAALIDPELRTRSAASGLVAERSRIIVLAARAVLADGRASDTHPLFAALVEVPAADEEAQAALIEIAAAAGHPAEARQRLDAAEAHLRDELTAEPGPALRRVREQLFAEPGPTSTLPRPLAHYVARAEVHGVRRLLSAWAADGRAHALVITGLAGIGKTTLATQWAAELAPLLPGGVVSLDLRGFDAVEAPLPPEEVLSELVQRLGAAHLGSSPRAALTRRLALRRTLIVLDDVATPAQVAPVLDLGGESLILITSRNRLTGLLVRNGLGGLALGRWAGSDLRELFRSRLESRPDVSSASVAALADASTGLPLAASVIAGRLTLSPGLAVADVLEELRSDRRLDAFSVGDPGLDVEGALLLSVRRLSENARRLLGLLSAHPNAPIERASASALDGRDDRRTRASLNELLQANLVIEGAAGSVILHDLVREVARSLQGEADRRVAALRLLDLYAQLSRDAARFMAPVFDSPVNERVIPGWFPIPTENAAAAFFRSHEGLLDALRTQAFEIGAHEQAIALVGYPSEFSFVFRPLKDTIRIYRQGLVAAEAIGDLKQAAYFQRILALTEYEGRRASETAVSLGVVLDRLRAAEDAFTARKDWRALAGVIRTRGVIEAERGRGDAAAAQLDRALQLGARHDIGLGMVFLLVARNDIDVILRDWPAAVEHGADALERFERLGARAQEYADMHLSIAAALSGIGQHRAALGELAAARAAVSDERVETRRMLFAVEARAADALGDADGARSAARSFWTRARDPMMSMDGPVALAWIRELQHRWVVEAASAPPGGARTARDDGDAALDR